MNMSEERGVEVRFRRHSGLLGLIEKILLICIPVSGIMAILDIFLYFGKSVWVEQYMAVFLGLIMTLVPLLIPATKASPRDKLPWYDAILSVIGFGVGFFVVVFYPDIVATSGLTPLDRTIMGAIAILFILESCRRLLGWALLGIVVLFILYAHFSYLFPGPLYSSGVPWVRLANYLYLDPGALFGVPIRIAGTIVLAFIFFGQVFFKIGGGNVLTDGALSLMGRYRGGPAKVAVLSSMAFGTISGSAVGNVVTTGTFTIPLMKRIGYAPHFAGAVEATASTGGQIMPPVMGVTAFLMAELLNIPYAEVALAAMLPAILYYLGLFVQVDLEAAKRGLKGLPSKMLPLFRRVLLDGWIFIIPVIVLVYTLFILYLEPDKAGLYSVISAFVVSTFKKASRINLKKVLIILESVGEALIEIGIIVGAAGLIIGVMSVSGLGFSFSLALTALAGGNYFILLLASALGASILGMGMPVLASYILVVPLVAPALVHLGMPPLCAHMFVFYYAVLSFLTPPVCLSVYAACSIANSKLMPTALQALRLGIAAYIVPFIFAYHPALLLQGTFLEVLVAVVTALIGIGLIAIAVESYLFRPLSWSRKILLCGGGLLSLIPGWKTDFLGLAIALPIVFWEWRIHRANKRSMSLSMEVKQ
jgi:TRAP transporter 4TM/12TM fusion protein